jgi:hypothetical protein
MGAVQFREGSQVFPRCRQPPAFPSLARRRAHLDLVRVCKTGYFGCSEKLADELRCRICRIPWEAPELVTRGATTPRANICSLGHRALAGDQRGGAFLGTAAHGLHGGPPACGPPARLCAPPGQRLRGLFACCWEARASRRI